MKLGNPNGAAALRRAGQGGAPLRKALSENADAFARNLAPVIEAVRAERATSLRGIAAALNERGILTRRGGRWHVSNARNLLSRLQGERKEDRSPARDTSVGSRAGCAARR